MDTHEIIRDLKKDLRAVMNGVASARMRQGGMQYKVNFGVELPRLHELAATLPHTHEVARALWADPVRECKILAAMVQPVESFCPEIAEIWVEDIREPELARLTVMHLFSRLPYAADCAFRWMADEREMHAYCGHLLMARLLMQDLKLNPRSEAEYLDQVEAAMADASPLVRQAAHAGLCKYMEQSDEAAHRGETLLARILK